MKRRNFLALLGVGSVAPVAAGLAKVPGAAEVPTIPTVPTVPTVRTSMARDHMDLVINPPVYENGDLVRSVWETIQETNKILSDMEFKK